LIATAEKCALQLLLIHSVLRKPGAWTCRFSRLRASTHARICSYDGFIAVTTVHPTMDLLGVRARFNDPESGGKVYPKSYDHTISAFVMAAEHAGLHFDEMSEHLITD
jgi:hypothetical protein